MLHIEQITKIYTAPHRAVDDVTLHLPAGSIGAIIGGNGVGKSTLLRCAARLLRPTDGSVEWGRAVLLGTTPRVAYLGEADYLYGAATVGENLGAVAQLCGCSSTKREAIAQQWEVEAWSTRRCDQLSRGQRRRVALARSWLAGRALLLLDEPLVGLDAHGVAQVRTALSQHRASGGSILLALQHDGELADLITHRWSMVSGRLCA